MSNYPDMPSAPRDGLHCTAMILAAGLGTRLRDLTQDKPKALVEVAGKSLLQRNIENLVNQGFQTIVVNVHHFAGQVIQFLKEHEFGAKLLVSDESDLLMDTGGGIVKATPLFADSNLVLVHNVDIISDVNFKELCGAFYESGDDAWLLTQNRVTSRKLLFDDTDRLVGWKNINDGSYKWVREEQIQYKELAFSGMHLIKPNLFASFDMQPGSVINMYLQLAKDHVIRSQEIHPDFWFDIGKRDDFDRINQFILP